MERRANGCGEPLNRSRGPAERVSATGLRVLVARRRRPARRGVPRAAARHGPDWHGSCWPGGRSGAENDQATPRWALPSPSRNPVTVPGAERGLPASSGETLQGVGLFVQCKRHASAKTAYSHSEQFASAARANLSTGERKAARSGFHTAARLTNVVLSA